MCEYVEIVDGIAVSYYLLRRVKIERLKEQMCVEEAFQWIKENEGYARHIYLSQSVARKYVKYILEKELKDGNCKEEIVDKLIQYECKLIQYEGYKTLKETWDELNSLHDDKTIKELLAVNDG